MVSWRQVVRDLRARIEFLEKENEELRKRLLAYENAHTPPSFSKKQRPKSPPSGKLGAVPGHPKWERKDPEPTGSVEYVEDACPRCHSKLGKPFKTVRVLEEEIPEPQPVEVIEHLVNHYKCAKCGKHVIARNDAPKGRFGTNVLTHVTLLKYDDRLPLRKVVSSLNRHYGLNLTDVSVLNITQKVAGALQIPYQELIQHVREAEVIYADETELRVDGLTYWVWTFVTSTQTLFVIRKSRAKKVVEEILGTSFKGVICCDGWTAYSQYSNNLQRCWAHLLREAKQLAENHASFKGFYSAFKMLYKKVLRVRLKPRSERKRETLREVFETELEQLLGQISAYTEFRKFANKVKNGLRHWFTCVTNLDVEPTNNIAERALRELVVQRKIIGGLRATRGADTMQVITSIIATLKQQHLPLHSTIKSYLKSR